MIVFLIELRFWIDGRWRECPRWLRFHHWFHGSEVPQGVLSEMTLRILTFDFSHDNVAKTTRGDEVRIW